MLKRLFQAFTTLSGSHRTDARYEGGRIARRCAIGFELSGDQAFRKLGRQAFLTREAVQDTKAVQDDQLPTTIEMLKAMAKELEQLESYHSLKERISEVYRG
jgi:hypothetical protein